MKAETELEAKNLMKNVTIDVTVLGMRGLLWRLWLVRPLLRFACWILGCGYSVTEPHCVPALYQRGYDDAIQQMTGSARFILPAPLDVWNGECGHRWCKSQSEACPYCGPVIPTGAAREPEVPHAQG